MDKNTPTITVSPEARLLPAGLSILLGASTTTVIELAILE